MHETDKFSALLSNENVGQMMCFINPSLDYIRVGDQLFAIDDSVGLMRRIKHTVYWCIKHFSGHQYEQILFGEADAPELIHSRHFAFSLNDKGIMLAISSLYDYSERVITGHFEHTLFNSISDAVVLTEADVINNPGPRIVFCNQAFLNMTGYKKNEVLGRSPRFLQGGSPDRDVTSSIRSSLSKWDTFKKTLTNYTKQGSPFEVELHISPVKDVTGWYSHWISVQRDVSGHKQVLDYIHKSNMIFQTSNIGCWYFNIHHDYLFWDEKTANIHFESGDNTASGINEWMELICEEHAERFNINVIRAISGEAPLDYEYEIKSENGEHRWVRVKAELTNVGGDVHKSLAGICFDITDEKLSLQAIESHRKVAERKAKLALLGEVAAGVGHEINNPLSVVTTSIDLLELDLMRGITTPAHFENITTRMRDACTRITKIVDGLRSVTSVTREHINLETIGLVDCIQETVEMLTKLYSKDGINVSLHVEGEKREYGILADWSGIQQIIVNLLSNARHAVLNSDNHIKDINIILTSKPQYCQLDVEDNGIGISENLKEKIFEPFTTNKIVGEGTGLGLSISKNLIESFGGSINFTSQPGRTCFTCHFIRGAVNYKQDDEHIVACTQERILLVEDDYSVGTSIVNLIEAMGGNCTFVDNGADALRILSEADDEFDVILTDIKMPILDGLHLLQSIKHRDLAPSARKYIMTGDVFSINEDSANRISTLAKGILKKPLTRADIAQVFTGIDKPFN